MTSEMPFLEEVDVIGSLCRDSYYDFVQEFWSTIIREEPVWNWHIEYLCNAIQSVMEDAFAWQPLEEDLVVNVPPATSKSTLFSVMLEPWVLTRRPDFRHLVATHTERLAMDLSRKSRDVVTSDKYKECFPYVKVRDDQSAKGYWLTTEGGGRITCTVGGASPTGMHAHLITIDDPIDPVKAFSAAEIENANSFCDNVIPNRKVNTSVVPTFLVMQRLAQNDPTGHWLKVNAFPSRHICMPAELVPKSKVTKGLEKYYVNGLLDPVRLSPAVLGRFRKLGLQLYSGQYLEDPVAAGGNMFNVDALHTGSYPPHLRQFRKIVRYWDKAGTQGGGKFTVGTKMGLHRSGRVWVLNVVRGQWDSGHREKIIKETTISDLLELDSAIPAAEQRAKVRYIAAVEQEPGSGGKDSALTTVRNLRGICTVHKHKVGKSDGDKINRADPLSTEVNQGNCYLCPGGWNSEWIDEFKHFPSSEFMDQVDSASGAYSYLVGKRVVPGSRLG